MEQENEYIQLIVYEYKEKVQPLLQYIPWLTEKVGNKSSNIYAGEGLGEHSVPVPVYDGTLMNFVKTVQNSGMLDRNYVYVYSRNRIRSVLDEKRMIAKATIKDMNVLTGILSKYIMGGMTKSALWPQGVEEGIYLDVVLKMREILEYWDKPLV